MIDTLIVLLQFVLVFLFCKDRDVKLVAGLLSLNFILQMATLPFFNYFSVLSGFDLLMLTSVLFISSWYKKIILFTIILCSLSMNIYEGLSYYQTFIYPYRDVIQWWMVEIMFIILAWNCNWRGIGYVKLRRINN